MSDEFIENDMKWPEEFTLLIEYGLILEWISVFEVDPKNFPLKKSLHKADFEDGASKNHGTDFFYGGGTHLK